MKFKIWYFLSSYLRFFTFYHLDWPRDYEFFEVSSRASFWHIIGDFEIWSHLISNYRTSGTRGFNCGSNNCILLMKLEIWPYFCDSWPRVTLTNIETNIFENMTSTASFCRMVWLLWLMLQIWRFWPFLLFLTLSDLDWPWKYFFLKILCQRLHFNVLYPYFWRFWNLNPLNLKLPDSWWL